MALNKKPRPFELMDCALITLAIGKRAINLRELRDRIAEVDRSSLYYHFYENLLQPSFDDPEFRNDFALWATRALNDTRLAEKLGAIDPLSLGGLEELRQEMIDVIEDHLAEREHIPWARHDQEFHFLTSRVVVFNTGRRFTSIEELCKFVPQMSTGSIFYHFIDARRRPPLNEDDFTAWLMQFGDQGEVYRRRFALVDFYFWTLPELRDRIARAFSECLMEEGAK